MSVTDGSLTTDGAQQTVRISGTVNTTSSGSGGTVTQGTPAATAGAWPVKVTDGTNSATVFAAESALNVHVTNTSNLPVQVSGTVNTSGTANQGSAAAIGGEWPVKISDGTTPAKVAGTGAAPTGAALLVSNGSLAAGATVTAATGAITGTTVDLGSAKANVTSMVVTGAGVSGGVLVLQVSQNGTDWFAGATSAALTASTVIALTVTGAAWRYARVVSTTNVAGGNVTCTIMGS